MKSFARFELISSIDNIFAKKALVNYILINKI